MDYRERFELREYRNERRLELRIKLAHAAVLGLMLFLGFNFWVLQAVHGDRYAAMAENNRLRRVPLLPNRGAIVDRNGHVLASTRPALNLMLRRENLREIDDQLRDLAEIVEMPEESMRARYRDIRERPVFEQMILMEDVAIDEVARIEARPERFPSVTVQEIGRRSYPDGLAVAHALGYIGEVGAARLEQEGSGLERGDLVGKAGVERVYDDTLRGRRGVALVSVNNVGRRLGAVRVAERPLHGEPLATTIDLRLQRILTEAFEGESGGAVFLDPRSGEILALVSAPAYDPNEFVGGISREAWTALRDDERRPLHNRAIASFYSPGSTFKVLMAVAGLEEKVVSTGTTEWCGGSTKVYGHRRLCWKRGGHGWVDVRKALTHSCNVYFYKLGQALPIDTIHDLGTRFGMGRVTGVDLTGEKPGILPSEAWKRRVHGQIWFPGDTISVAIGQGYLGVTPLQMATMIAGIATGGDVPKPHIVAGGGGPATRVEMDPANLDAIRGALVDVVNEGTARRARIDGYQVAGKTGTAQVFKHSAGIDADLLPKDERDHAWFVGYAPAESPRIAFAIVVEHGGHGGTTAAPIAKKVIEAFREYEEADARPRDPALTAERPRAPRLGGGGPDARAAASR